MPMWILLTIGVLVGANGPAIKEGEDPIFYQDYLTDIGDQLECYFVIERQADSSEITSPLSVTDISNEPVDSIDALLAKLRADLPGVTVRRLESNSPVILLVESSLATDENYAMGRTVTVTHEGLLRDLISRIGAQVEGIGVRTGGGIPIEPEDVSTRTKIDVKQRPVRQVLADAVPKRGYQRILWEAVTYSAPKRHTEIRFTGPLPQSPVE